MKVLLVKLSSLGDIVHAFPAVTEALAQRPELEIDWLVDRPYVDLVRLHPGVGRIVPNDALRRGTAWWIPHAWAAVAKTGADVATSPYDLVIDAQGLLRSAILARSAKSPIIGFDRASIREAPASLAYARTIAASRTLHATDRIRLLFAAALGYEVMPGSAPAPDGLAGRANASAGRQVLLLHGTGQVAKRWPFDNWYALAAHLVQRGLIPVVTGGDSAELDLSARLASLVPGTKLVSRLPFAELAQLIDAMSLVISVDTGLGHLADARGVPTIMLFQGSDPRLTGPFGLASRALWSGDIPTRPRRRERARPTSHSVVDPGQVIAAIETVMSEMARP